MIPQSEAGKNARKHGHSSRFWVAVTLLGPLVVLAFIVLVINHFTERATPPPKLTFTNPAESERIHSPLELGLSGDVATDAEVWVLTRPKNGRYYTTTDKPVHQRADRTWVRPTISVGRSEGDVNNEFDLVAVVASAGDNLIRQELAKTPGEQRAVLEDLPAEHLQEVASVHVILASWTSPSATLH